LHDSAKLDAYYYLTPLPKQSLRAEVNATNKSNNLTGTQLSVSWSNRNRFRAGERVSISAYIGSEVSFGGAWKGYNNYRSGAELNFTVPRFFVPFYNKLNTRGGFVPRTNIQLGYDLLNKQKLYTLNSYRGAFGFLWKESLQKQHEFYPISINYVQPLNITKEFKDSTIRFPYLLRVVDSQFIIGSTYQYNMNQATNGLLKTNSFYFNGLVDMSGFLAGLFTSKGADNQKRILGADFNQYIKLEADFRYYRKIGLKSAWANRIIAGYGKPYGNSQQLPYVKQFFIGGNNSIRAFRARTIGPGTYPLLAQTDAFPDQTGDMKLEINTEFRPHISGPVYGAIFLDAGNIWLSNDDPSRPGAKFTKNFLKELAIGTGVGLRFDITLFVIRFDVGIPLKEPWKENPWLLNQIRLGKREWRRENIVYNLGIGYPF
jgi:outer membrane protein assembly factor BamA